MLLSVKEWKKRLPVFTLTTVSLSLLGYWSGLDANLQYDRSAITEGQLWRIFTGHLVHWNFDHLLWCCLTFLALGIVCEKISRKGLVATVVLSSLVIPLFILAFVPEMTTYRGLSGIASALFVFGALIHWQESSVRDDRWGSFLSFLAGSAYIGKVVFEYATGQTLFVPAQDIFVPIPLVHFVGGIIGIVMALLCFSPGKGKRPGPVKLLRYDSSVPKPVDVAYRHVSFRPMGRNPE